MAGKIVADTLEHSTAGSIATNYVVEGSAKAWVSFNGTGTLAVIGSFNQSSMTDNGTGDYSLTVSNAMNDANYSVQVSNSTYASTYAGWATTHRNGGTGGFVAPTTTVTRMNTMQDTNSSAQDGQRAEIGIHGDLA